jgi:uncharacterized protein (TIGR00369 family)
MPSPRPTAEQLATYAAGFNGSATLRYFQTVLSFPTTELVRAVIDPIPPEMLGGMGMEVVNGGVLSAMFDLVLGSSAALVDPTRRAATMQLSMNFMRPLGGPRLVAEAWVDRAGSETVFSSAHLLDASGTVCGRAQGVVKLARIGWSKGGSPGIN